MLGYQPVNALERMLPKTSFFEIFIIFVIMAVCSVPLLAVAGAAVARVVAARRNRGKEK
jgi:hypothetical protein